MSSTAPGDSELLTVREVAEELRLTQQTVRQWIRDAKLPAMRAGERKYLVRRADLQQVVAFAGDANFAGATTFADGVGSPRRDADPALEAPTPGARDAWDLASHARPPR